MNIIAVITLLLAFGPNTFCANPKIDFCAHFYDYSGQPCRVFSDCPMLPGAEFLFYSREFPCKKYVVDQPIYYETEMSYFQSQVLTEHGLLEPNSAVKVI